MRPVLVADLLYAGRALLAAPPEQGMRRALTLLGDAERADRHRQATGQRHPVFGDGTLAAAAQAGGLAPERVLCDPEFARALIVVLQALVGHCDETDRVRR